MIATGASHPGHASVPAPSVLTAAARGSASSRCAITAATTALAGFGRLDRLLRGLTAPAGQRHDIVIGRTAHRVAGGIGVVRRPFATRALTQHTSQAEEDEHRQRQEDDGVNIHVEFAFWF